MSEFLSHFLDDDDVIAFYNAILKRPPESDSVLDYYRKNPLNAVQMTEALIGSREFKIKQLEQGESPYIITGTPPYCYATLVRDNTIGRMLRWGGKFDEDDVASALGVIENRSGRGGIFLDIGANIGTHSLYALRHGFDGAVCVEPEPGNFKLLKINQILNDVDGRCRNIQAAVSDVDGVLELELAADNFGDHRVRGALRENGSFDEASRAVISIQSVTFASLLRQQSLNAADLKLVWIDTQGHEGQVLSHAEALLERRVPCVIEFWPYGLARAGGFESLRGFLARCSEIAPVRNPEDRLSMERIDALYTQLRDQPDAGAAYLDLLLLP